MLKGSGEVRRQVNDMFCKFHHKFPASTSDNGIGHCRHCTRFNKTKWIVVFEQPRGGILGKIQANPTTSPPLPSTRYKLSFWKEKVRFIYLHCEKKKTTTKLNKQTKAILSIVTIPRVTSRKEIPRLYVLVSKWPHFYYLIYMKFWRHVNLAILKNPYLAAL